MARLLLLFLAVSAALGAGERGLAASGPTRRERPRPAEPPRADAPAEDDEGRAASGEPAVDRAFELVYQIKTAVSAEASKASYGSGFVVGTDGLIATNFHVVADALHEPGKYKIFLVDGAESIPARVVKINAVNDLALVRVERRFPRALALAPRLPRAGERIFSLGLPEDLNKSVIEGNFNGIVAEGPYEKVQMAIPLNSGMSGGPTVNQAGELVGVNVSVLLFAQNLAFAVPASQLAALLAAPETPVTGAFPVNVLVAGQLREVQSRLTEELVSAAQRRLQLPGFKVNAAPSFLKCWRTSEDGQRGKWADTEEDCELGNAAMITAERYGGTLRTRHLVLDDRKLNPLQFFNLIESHTISDMTGTYAEGFSTPFACDDADIVNARGVPLKVQYCLNTYVRLPGLYDVDVVAATVLPGAHRALIFAAYFSAFAADNAQKLVGLYLDAIEAEK